MPRDPSTPRPMIWNGFHGYNDKHPDMRTIFMAKGPSFKKHYQGEPLKLVDMYQIYAHVLGIEPQPHNGSWARVRSYLTNHASSNIKIVNHQTAIILASLAFIFKWFVH